MDVGRENTCEGGRTAQSGLDGVDPKVSDLPDIRVFVQSGMICLYIYEHALHETRISKEMRAYGHE